MPLSAVRGFSPSALAAAMTRKPAQINDVADAIGISRQSVTAWLKGKSSPTPDVLARTAQWLNIPIADLVPIPADRLRISDLRVRAGLSQKAAAAGLGMPASTVADIEKGRRPVSADVVARFAELYDQDVAVVAASWDRANAARRAYLDSL